MGTGEKGDSNYSYLLGVLISAQEADSMENASSSTTETKATDDAFRKLFIQRIVFIGKSCNLESVLYL